VRPALSVLDAGQVESVLAEAMRLLAEVGVDVCGARLRERLLEAGLRPDGREGRLTLPEDVVRRAIASAPSTIVLHDRDGQPHARLGSGQTHFVPGSSGLSVLDHRTGEARLARTRDFVEYVRLADGLSNIAYLATAFSTEDIEPGISDAWRLYLSLVSSRKPVVSGAFTEHGVTRMVELMALFRRDRADLAARPMAIFTVTPAGTFRYNEDSCQNLLDCVEAGIPVEIVPVTLMGLLAPVTTLGAAAFHAADVLAGVTMAQIVRPGAPVLFGAAPATFHMMATTSPMAAIEAMRLAVVSAQLARAVGLPSQAYLGFSEGKVLDAQAGAETAMGAMLAALAGVDSVSGPGMLDFLLTFSLPKLVLDDELAGQVLHFVRDVRPTGDLPAGHLVDDLFSEGHLLIAQHTLAHWPDELHVPGPVIDRDPRERWTSKGSSDTLARASAEVERILASWEPPVTDPAVDAEARTIIRGGLSEGDQLPALPDAAG
jgi:trimethylamine---corrinoid protein Co-methyltransferase